MTASARYDPGSNLWESDVPPLPEPARGIATASLGKQIYVVAGDLACRLTAGAAAWEKIPAPSMRTHHLAMAVVDGYVYAIGGIRRIGGKQVTVGEVERYDPVAGKWTAVAPLQQPRHSMACGVIGNKIYACGGTGDDQLATRVVEVYDPATGAWTFGPSMLRARGGASAGVLMIVPPGPAAGAR